LGFGMMGDFDIRLKKEAKTSLQMFKDQSLLRRKFGEDAVKLYNLIDSGRPASEMVAELGMPEEKFVQILEFMNNNAMVSVLPADTAPVRSSSPPDASEKPAAPLSPSQEEGSGLGRKEAKLSPETFSPLEKILYDKYGELGVRIYSLIDGEKTAEEILHRTGVSESRLVEILEFMDEQGIIKLEKPGAKKDGDEGEAGKSEDEESEKEESEEADSEDGDKGEKDQKKEGDKSAAAREPRFKPMIEEDPEEKPFEAPKPPPKPQTEKEKKKDEEPEEDIIQVDVPSIASLSLMQKAVLFTELSTKFGKGARELIDHTDGKRDFIELSLATGLSFFDIDSIMGYFGKKGFLTFRVLSRDEIKKKYGEDGFAIYKKFGRDGLLLYEMIGKEASLKDIISKSKVDPDRAIDIFVFIHKALGLDIPLDRDIIYRQLGLKK